MKLLRIYLIFVINNFTAIMLQTNNDITILWYAVRNDIICIIKYCKKTSTDI